MNSKPCPECLAALKEAQRHCHSCGYKLELTPEEEQIEKYINRPSPGALLWTQAYALSTRQYTWLLVSLIPIVGIIATVKLFLKGRKNSWETGSWKNFKQYKKRQRLSDIIAYIWAILLTALCIYLIFIK